MLGFSLEGGTLDWYEKALGDGLYLRVIWNTFEIALLVTLFCLLLGYPLGFLIATTTPVWATLGFIFVLLPLWTSRCWCAPMPGWCCSAATASSTAC